MATESVKYLLIGGGVAAAQGAVGIREVDKEGSVLIVCREQRMPYDRPPLSKGFLNFKPSDPEDIESKDVTWYPNNNVQVRPGVEATRVDRPNREVYLDDGSVVRYDKLLLATGSTPRHLDIPGVDLPNVFFFRTVEQADAIRNLVKEASNIVLIGAGYVGMEVSASLSQQEGKNLTVIDPSPYPWSRSASPITGGFLQAYFENKGIKFLFGDQAEEIAGEGKAQTVRTKNGHAAPADLVIIGVGVTLNTQLAAEAGLTVDKDGVHVNEYLQSEDDENIWIAGDIAAFQDVVVGKRWHAEHYMNARWQGNRAGKNMAGENEKYEKVPYFFSDMFDLSVVLRGDSSSGRTGRVLGDVDTGEFVELYVDTEDRVVCGIGVTRDGDRYDPITDALEKLVLEKRIARDLTKADVGLE